VRACVRVCVRACVRACMHASMHYVPACVSISKATHHKENRQWRDPCHRSPGRALCLRHTTPRRWGLGAVVCVGARVQAGVQFAVPRHDSWPASATCEALCLSVAPLRGTIVTLAPPCTRARAQVCKRARTHAHASAHAFTQGRPCHDAGTVCEGEVPVRVRNSRRRRRWGGVIVCCVARKPRASPAACGTYSRGRAGSIASPEKACEMCDGATGSAAQNHILSSCEVEPRCVHASCVRHVERCTAHVCSCRAAESSCTGSECLCRPGASGRRKSSCWQFIFWAVRAWKMCRAAGHVRGPRGSGGAQRHGLPPLLPAVHPQPHLWARCVRRRTT